MSTFLENSVRATLNLVTTLFSKMFGVSKLQPIYILVTNLETMMNKISHEYDLLCASRCGNEGKEEKAIVLSFSVRTLIAKVLSRAWKVLPPEGLKFSCEYSVLLKHYSKMCVCVCACMRARARVCVYVYIYIYIYIYCGLKVNKKLDKREFLRRILLMI